MLYYKIFDIPINVAEPILIIIIIIIIIILLFQTYMCHYICLSIGTCGEREIINTVIHNKLRLNTKTNHYQSGYTASCASASRLQR